MRFIVLVDNANQDKIFYSNFPLEFNVIYNNVVLAARNETIIRLLATLSCFACLWTEALSRPINNVL